MNLCSLVGEITCFKGFKEVWEVISSPTTNMKEELFVQDLGQLLTSKTLSALMILIMGTLVKEKPTVNRYLRLTFECLII